MRKNYIRLLILTVFCPAILLGCGKSSRPEETKITEIQSQYEESAADHYEKGYNLPVAEAEQAEAETECREVLELVRGIYEHAGKGDAKNPVLSQDAVEQMFEAIAAAGLPVSLKEEKYGMGNHEQMEAFLRQILNGEPSEMVLYRVMSNGGLARQKFRFDGENLYSLYTIAKWDRNGNPSVAATTNTRIKEWNYTEKGWFYFEYCVPEPPEVTEVINGNQVLRVKPFKEEYLEMTQKYLLPVSYQGNNLFRSNWDADHLENLDYTGVFEYFYYMKNGERPVADWYQDGVPAEEFEGLMIKHLPVTVEQLRQYCPYDEEKGVYEWYALGCGDFSPDILVSAYPEVTEVENHPDGTVTMTVDAVSGATDDDAMITHKLTVRLTGDGDILYLSNQVVKDERGCSSIYQYRFPMKSPVKTDEK